MLTIKPYMIGEDQYIDLPEEFNFKGSEVEIFRNGDEVILREKPITAEQANIGIVQIPTDLSAEVKEDKSPK
ncbi:AbrB/MazE/SpoVT family DNA-binding domain-containing protein [Acinetobacter defluvii]|uniref:AbrB/MazE/SpoVT family DNA-binding domain-containing protein n=1 Tax=Acinetobacter defluvii TaxID=1871111 RepID=A0A2S2FHG0_9GAMM|nr:hypothetical protein [Acinetobacter defluvii]AWL29802.1 AbrB/MazE/SpoVT family DNA-binding domain-containing protein [Acinetobacter defluvii]